MSQRGQVELDLNARHPSVLGPSKTVVVHRFAKQALYLPSAFRKFTCKEFGHLSTADSVNLTLVDAPVHKPCAIHLGFLQTGGS